MHALIDRKQCILIIFSCLMAACADIQPNEVEQDSRIQQVLLCHVDSTGSFLLLERSRQDFASHLLHGDGIPGGAVPGLTGFVFSETCKAIEDSNEGLCQEGMTHIDGFCIDRWEASLKGHSPFDVPVSGGVAQAVQGVIPQGYISGEVAEAACKAVGKRLCTSSEWLRACQGPEISIFPYGNTYIDSACNEGRSLHPVIELFSEETDWSPEQMNDSRINQLPNTVDSTGSNPVCMSAEGIYDLHGNLHEWVADPSGTFRGGFYVDAEINGKGCLYRTTAHGRTYHDYSTGFRCCSNAQY